MKKGCCIAFSIGFIPLALLFWGLLKDVEENGAVYGLLDIAEGVLVIFVIILVLALFVLFVGYIPHRADKYVKKLPTWLQNLIIVAYTGLVLYLAYLFVNGVGSSEEIYRNYKFQKKFEHKYDVDF